MYKKSFLLGILFSFSIVVVVFLFDINKKEPVNITEEDSLVVALTDINFVPTSGGVPMPSGRVMQDATSNKGKPTIVHVWGPGCPACVQEMPDFNEFSKKYRESINIIPLTVSSNPEHIRSFYEKHGLKDLALCLDQEGVTQKLGVRAMPTTIFYDGEGQEMGRILGAVDWTGKAGQVILKSLGVTEE